MCIVKVELDMVVPAGCLLGIHYRDSQGRLFLLTSLGLLA